MKLVYCPECFEKQRRIDELEEDVRRLKAQLRYQQRTAVEGPFGSSTPSSKIAIKPNSLEERQEKRGGARPGHGGHGRQAVDPQQADRVEGVEVEDTYPRCGGRLEGKGVRWWTANLSTRKWWSTVWNENGVPGVARASRLGPRGCCREARTAIIC
jgi:hypothetical protein